ncbi:MAG: division/cell wall cluster transcriptional repressor MraZ [Chitinophagaceae bacterium]
MIAFLGEYEATMDSKGRFLLPAALKKQLPEGDTLSFVINRGFEKCLTLYPLSSWNPIFSNISKLNDFDPKVREFRRWFLNGAIQMELDTAGRLLIPKNLIEHAGLDKDIVLASAMNKLEIWDKVTYHKFFEQGSPEAFSNLAAQVMSDKPIQ